MYPFLMQLQKMLHDIMSQNTYQRFSDQMNINQDETESTLGDASIFQLASWWEAKFWDNPRYGHSLFYIIRN